MVSEILIMRGKDTRSSGCESTLAVNDKREQSVVLINYSMRLLFQAYRPTKSIRSEFTPMLQHWGSYRAAAVHSHLHANGMDAPPEAASRCQSGSVVFIVGTPYRIVESKSIK